MPALTDHSSLEFVKGLYLGDPGAGKTGSLTSLVKAGYSLRIYDFDNLLTPLVQYVLKECPERAAQVAYQTFTDKMKGVDMPAFLDGKVLRVQPFTDGAPTAFTRALKQLNYWKTPTEDFGPASAFGSKTVVVIDSLTSMSSAIFRYCQAMNPAAKEPQSTYFSAQQMVVNVLSLLASDDFRSNVLVIAHVSYTQDQFEITKGFPRSIGSALNSQIAAFFNSVLLAQSANNRRTIVTNSTGIIDLKCPASFRVPATLPLESGLATFFEAVKGESQPKAD